MGNDYVPAECLTRHGGAGFDLPGLIAEFSNHCTDFQNELDDHTPSRACHFAVTVIYTIGPESREVLKRNPNQCWVLEFPVTVNNHVESHRVFIVPDKRAASVYKPDNQSKSMVLTLEEAGLLAQIAFKKLIVAAMGRDVPKKLMTPQAGACFSKDGMENMAQALNMTVVDLLVAVNASTQSGGQYLDDSDVDIAVCAAVAVTRMLKESIRKSIVMKLLNQYIARQKIPNQDRMAVIAPYTTGAVPAKFSYENLKRRFDAARVAAPVHGVVPNLIAEPEPEPEQERDEGGIGTHLNLNLEDIEIYADICTALERCHMF